MASETNHPWCRDVRRDESIRAAEDAAAVPSIQHRDLPDQVALLWASVGDIIGRVVRLEGEMDAGQDEEAAPAVCDSVPLANGLRTERVTPPWQRAKWDEALAIICDGGDWGRGNNFDHGVLGALVIWADKEMDRLTAERDLARAVRDGLRSQRDAARARVAELEAATPPRGWLTRHERWRLGEMVAWLKGRAAEHPDTIHAGLCGSYAADIDAILARSTPPMVKVPPGIISALPHEREQQWIAAIRAAGGEVEE